MRPRRSGRIDRDDDATQLRRGRNATAFDQRARKQRVRPVFQQLGVEFLPA
jgi:hypothetical protein